MFATRSVAFAFGERDRAGIVEKKNGWVKVPIEGIWEAYTFGRGSGVERTDMCVVNYVSFIATAATAHCSSEAYKLHEVRTCHA